MRKKITTPPRYMFWHEIAYAVKTSNPRKVWDIDHIIREIVRVPENSHHVPMPMPPVSVYGLEVGQLLDFVIDLKTRASLLTEPYTARGVARTRKQSNIKPILMVGIASYAVADPEMRETEDRRQWINLVVEAVKTRVEAESGQLVSVVLHLDEAFAHLHCICAGSTIGSRVRSLHWGFRASDAEPVKAKKGAAYRAGCERIQNWFYESVGSKMGWLRKRVDNDSFLDLRSNHHEIGPHCPRLRLSRSQAQRNRQLQLETEAAALRKRNIELEKRAQELAAAQVQLNENVNRFDADFDEGERYLNRRLEEIEAAEEKLKRDREQVQSIKNEYETKKLRIEAEAAVMWNLIDEAAEKTKAWQLGVRDQIALENRLAKIRGRARPGSAGSVASNADDDLSDIPL